VPFYFDEATVSDSPDELNAADPRFVSLASTAADEGAPDAALQGFAGMIASMAILMVAMLF
jgi:hypothetical protein